MDEFEKTISTIRSMNNKGIYDFYYSKNHAEYLKEISSENLFLSDNPNITMINGIVYTEAIHKGCTPITNHFGDLELVFTGTFETFEILGKY